MLTQGKFNEKILQDFQSFMALSGRSKLNQTKAEESETNYIPQFWRREVFRVVNVHFLNHAFLRYADKFRASKKSRKGVIHDRNAFR